MAVDGELFSQSDWRKSLISQIQKRNKEENERFIDLISFHNRLFDNWTALRHENLQLTIQNEKLRVEGGGSSGDSNEAKISNLEQISTLEQKLLHKQEELTELHKQRGEKAQLINDLKDSVKEKERQINVLQERLAASTSECASLRAEIDMYNSNKKNLEDLNQHLKDEYHALHLEFVHIEDKLRKTQEENGRLLERLIKYKSKDAEKMNEENENFLSDIFKFVTRHRNAKMQKELEDAAKDTRGLSPEQIPNKTDFGCPALTSVVPTKPIIKFDAHDGEVDAVQWSPVDRIVATGGADRKVKLWDVSKGVLEPKGMLVGSNRGIMSVDFDSTGTLILGASSDFATRVWTVADQRLRHTLTGHSDKVMAAKFLGEPSKVVTGSYDRTLKIWDLRGRACQHTKFAGSSCNDLVTTDGSGSTVISGHFDKKVRFWDTRTESVESDLQLGGRVTSLDISRDGRFLLACVRDDTLRVLDLRMNNRILYSLSHDDLKISCDWARAVFSSDAKQVAVGSSDGSIFIFETATNKIEAILKDELKAAVTAVAWHSFANYIASVGRNKKAIIWADL